VQNSHGACRTTRAFVVCVSYCTPPAHAWLRRLAGRRHSCHQRDHAAALTTRVAPLGIVVQARAGGLRASVGLQRSRHPQTRLAVPSDGPTGGVRVHYVGSGRSVGSGKFSFLRQRDQCAVGPQCAKPAARNTVFSTATPRSVRDLENPERLGAISRSWQR
jgi:hypothetical protein